MRRAFFGSVTSSLLSIKPKGNEGDQALWPITINRGHRNSHFKRTTRSTMMMMQATPAIPSVGQKHLWIFETKDLWYHDLLSFDIDLFMLILLLGSCYQLFWFDPFGPAGQYIGFWVLKNSDLRENIEFLLCGLGCFCTSLPKMWTPPLKAHVHRCYFDFLASCTIFCWKDRSRCMVI